MSKPNPKGREWRLATLEEDPELYRRLSTFQSNSDAEYGYDLACDRLSPHRNVHIYLNKTLPVFDNDKSIVLCIDDRFIEATEHRMDMFLCFYRVANYLRTYIGVMLLPCGLDPSIFGCMASEFVSNIRRFMGAKGIYNINFKVSSRQLANALDGQCHVDTRLAMLRVALESEEEDPIGFSGAYKQVEDFFDQKPNALLAKHKALFRTKAKSTMPSVAAFQSEIEQDWALRKMRSAFTTDEVALAMPILLLNGWSEDYTLKRPASLLLVPYLHDVERKLPIPLGCECEERLCLHQVHALLLAVATGFKPKQYTVKPETLARIRRPVRDEFEKHLATRPTKNDTSVLFASRPPPAKRPRVSDAANAPRHENAQGSSSSKSPDKSVASPALHGAAARQAAILAVFADSSTAPVQPNGT